MARIFAYIAHKGGVADDSAAELLAAAKKIDAAASPTAIVTGWGAELDAVCDSPARLLRRSLENRERGAGLSQCRTRPPSAGERRAAGQHRAGCARSLRNRSVAGAVDQAERRFCLRRGRTSTASKATALKLVRQEFGGQVSTHVRCDISSGAVINLRPGAFKPLEGAAVNGAVVDKSAEVGTLTAKRRYLETVVAEAGDVDITKQPVLVSVGRGIQEKDNVAIAAGAGRRAGRGGELLASGGRRQVAAEVPPGRLVRARP